MLPSLKRSSFPKKLLVHVCIRAVSAASPPPPPLLSFTFWRARATSHEIEALSWILLGVVARGELPHIRVGRGTITLFYKTCFPVTLLDPGNAPGVDGNVYTVICSDVLLVRIDLVQELHGLLIPARLSALLQGYKRKVPYMVKTMPPLKISLPSLGTAPDQKVRTPSSLKIRAAQLKLFLYSCFASIDCIRVLMVSSGMVAYLGKSTRHVLGTPAYRTYTVMIPAMPPMPNVLIAPSFSPGAT